jgi:hypothetical protein
MRSAALSFPFCVRMKMSVSKITVPAAAEAVHPLTWRK